MANLYAGTVLFVDLGDGKITREPTASYCASFIGGRGIDDKLLYDHIVPQTDSLAPGNVIAMGTGPLSGTCLPSSGRLDIMSKSPLTGLWGDSNVGGYFAPELKFAGYDNILISGKAEKPVYLWIENERVEIRDASETWGKDTYETPILIRRELKNPEAKVLCIGPAGENLVRFASVQSELGNGAGRTGIGAVMGSKNLKAIAVRGTKGIQTANPQEFLACAMELTDIIKNSDVSKELSKYGTAMIQSRMAGDGKPYRNFQTFATYEGKLKPIDVVHMYAPKKVGCYNCPNRCMEAYDVAGIGSGVISCAFYPAAGMTVDNNDPAVFLKNALYCQQEGMDVAAVGGIMAWVMELYERGVITAQDTDGVPLEWGHSEAISGLLRKIVRREGFGDVLADGILIGAQKIGPDAEEYAMHCKGLPMFTESPIIEKGKALAMAVGPRGDHYRGYPIIEGGIHRLDHSEMEGAELEAAKEKLYQKAEAICGTRKGAVPDEYEGKPLMVKYNEDFEAITDCLGICKWASPRLGIDAYTEEEQASILSLGLGKEISTDMLFETADRLRCLERAFSIREGLTRAQEKLPRRMFEIVTPDGLSLSREKVEDMITQYYAVRGWDPDTGIPTRETLEKLDLGYVADDLEKRDHLKAKPPEHTEA